METSTIGKNNVCSRDLKMVFGSFYIPKDNALKPQGEDSHFLLPELQTFGLADGVGGWAEEGIDSGLYSRELMNNTVLSIQGCQDDGPVDPKTVLNEAFLKTDAQGSSTACVISLHDATLYAVNIGDSGFVHIRGGKIIYKSPVQQHRFNHPYQLQKGNSEISLAEEIRRDVEYGDIIVAGTDGLFDNVHAEELELLVREGLENLSIPEFLALKIADYALRQSENEFVISPFAVEKHKAKGSVSIGGKSDDITVIVAYICS